ncbi:hypothetical protein QN219_10580 [Sinorhizobium sp. 7-81]|uniref:helix-turn-helix domain-containing transcriptional regulator n=1 Tax=Sinorhizobium sp. 8-89 TaxID=3049089 RepID=UPI0024C346A8|nr:hypothetical protein [Sinorhizobium sp. 8-89]MDK1490504.1 hypothetical protein [Sinorhizobium sp. 8-89]
MALETIRFDIQDFLKTPEEQAGMLEAALEDGDPELIATIIDEIARARGTTMVEQWVKDMTEEVLGKSSMEVGKTVRHPDGRNVLIVSGQYWGTHGLSNFWHWKEVREDGTYGPEESGYGW